jgi:hypothetical protein
MRAAYANTRKADLPSDEHAPSETGSQMKKTGAPTPIFLRLEGSVLKV